MKVKWKAELQRRKRRKLLKAVVMIHSVLLAALAQAHRPRVVAAAARQPPWTKTAAINAAMALAKDACLIRQSMTQSTTTPTE